MACRFRVALVAGAWLMALPLASAAAPEPTGPAAPLAGAAFAAADPPEPYPGEVLVRYRAGLAPAERDQVAHAFGARPVTRYHLIDLDRVKVAEPLDSALARLRADPRVLYAEPNYIVHALRTPNDPRFGQQYQYHNVGQTGGTPGADISALRAWDVFTGDSTLMIGMIDSGIDYDHPDLAANVWTNPGEIPGNGIDDDGDGYVDDVHGYDFANNDGDPMDDNGHGTHTAGIVAAVGNNGVGVTGVAWRARLVAIKFLDSSGSGTIADAIAGLQYAVTVGCRLTSNSWGGGPPSQAMLDAINAAGQAGLLFVAAAGNSGLNTDLQPAYPASYDSPYILSVAATDNTDSLAVFSNYGPNSVDIAAPGVAILSTLPGERYGLLSGTSMACPMVTGAAALALGLGPNLGPLAVKNMLMNGADRLPQLTGLVQSGRLNAFNVIATPDSIPPGPITDLTVLDVGSSTVDLRWTATGDDGAIGRASSYDVRWSTAPITPQNFAVATSIPGTPDPNPTGTPEAFTATGLPFTTTVYFAIRALDEYANAGPVSNVVSATTLGPPHLAFTPDSALGATLTGGADSTIVTLKNVGQGILAFSIPTPAIAYAAWPPPPAHTSLPSAKGTVEAQGVATTVHAGGPDGFGYRWIDSDTTAGPQFNWIDVTAIGTQVNLNGDDFLTEPIPLGFSFPFYGNKFDSVKVCTNGFLTFTDVVPFYVNTTLPGTSAPYNAIMPFWDDLLFGVEHRAWVWGDGTKIVFEYQAVPHYDTGGPYTFEVILLPTGEIRFQYLDLAPPVNSATVGLQDDAGRNGLQVVYNGAYLHNSLAIKLASIGQWVAAAPTSGRISAGDSLPVTVRFNASGLPGGQYRADLRIDSDDPSAPATHVPVRLRVVGAPDIQVVPPALDFGAVYVGARASALLAVNNPGSDVLNVSGIAVSDTSIHVDETPFQIGRFERRVLTVTWAPDRAGPLAATLTLTSNDPDTPQLVVPLAGTGLPAPSVRGDPDSLSASLRTGASATQTLHVLNSGAGDYVFRAVPLSGPGAAAMQIDRQAPPLEKGAPDVRHGVSALNSGGPDDFGYTFRDSREPDGPAFRWEDARALGTPILLSGDDAVSAPLALPFAFPFYAESFSSVRVCTNGFLSFTSTSTSFSNTPLPSQATDVPENLVAPWWDDFTFPTNEAWYFADTAHAVVEFAGVSRFGEPGRTNTFEAVLNADGSIEYRYLAVGAQNAASATVGIQNGTRDDGLLVAYNTPYLRDSLAVRITRPPRWLTVTPDTGRVAPGGSLDLGVTFHAAGLSGGRYDGRIQLVGNDPLAPHFDVPAHLDVQGVPILALHPGALDFGRVSIGVPLSLPLTVENAGSDTLRIDKLTSGDPRFTTDPSQFALAPFSSLDASVTFAPTATGPAGATLTARSNDPAAPEQTIPLTGSGAEPPRAALSATTLRSALSHDVGGRALAGVQRVVIGNPGGNDLTYRALALPGPALTTRSAPVDHESPKGQVDPPASPSAAGSGAGGPDAFGYRWVSSDDPSGPPFQWIDARAGGTALPLDQDDQLSATIALPFPFLFYGSSFDAIRVCTNGFASFTSTLTTFSNTPLPNTGSIVPRNLLAAFWDDQDFRPQSGSASAYVLGDTSRFVIAFYDVPHLTIGGPYTYEIVLKRDGTIEYRYLTMGTRLTEATVGIQNGDGTIGLQAAYNAAFVHDHLTVRFTLLPPWVAVSPKSGTVAPGGADTLTVAFSAAGYPDGDYDGAVRLEDNVPGEGVRELPAHLRVGIASAALRVTTPALAVTDRDRGARFTFTLPGANAAGADPGSMRVNDSLAVVRAGPADSAFFAVDVLDLLRPMGGGIRVPVGLTGEIPGVTWFAARDTLTLSRPALIAPVLAPFGTGTRPALASDGPIDVSWSDAPGHPSSSWDVWLSNDAGRHWSPLALRQPKPGLRWMPPALVDSAMLEIVGSDRGVPVAALITDPFRLLPADSLNGGHPKYYRLSLKGGNPVVSAAALELAVPQGGPVDVVVFDIFGARVRTLLHSTATSERLPIGWNLRDDDGRSVHPGVYFVRATSRGRTAIARLAVLR